MLELNKSQFSRPDLYWEDIFYIIPNQKIVI